jgi:hypothetical protein
MAYLGQLRAEHAAVLLLPSDEPVTSIGRAVGWPDQSGFARRFKAHYGLSASAYRKRFATNSAISCFGNGPAVGLQRDVVQPAPVLVIVGPVAWRAPLARARVRDLHPRPARTREYPMTAI